MSQKLIVIKEQLKEIIKNIDAGNSNITEEQEQEMLNLLISINRKELTKIESANYIGVSRATFDNYVSRGLIPKGTKRQGCNQLFWNKFDLDKYLNEQQIS